MLVIRFGKWCNKATSMFVYNRVYRNGCEWTPLCIKKFRYVHGSKHADLRPLPLQVEPRWIPVSERLPEEDRYYLVTLMPVEAPNESFVEKCRFFKDEWYQGFLTEISEKYIRVVAWRPLPKPYEVTK